jgi:hypothetical protein
VVVEPIKPDQHPTTREMRSRSEAEPFWRRGIKATPGFFSSEECESLLTCLEAYRRRHKLPKISRADGDRPLEYLVVDGERFDAVFPCAEALVDRVRLHLEAMCGCALELLDDRRAARNVNITPPGGQYRWHYDRNLVTAVLYLNTVEGGETEILPNYRVRLPTGRPRTIQGFLDRCLRIGFIQASIAHRKSVAPMEGTLLVICGNRSLHSVRTVLGGSERINVVLAFDLPGSDNSSHSLDNYLYCPDVMGPRLAQSRKVLHEGSP